MISKTIYSHYLNSLISGKIDRCKEIVSNLLDGGTPIKDIYIHLFQRSLYDVGKLWEENRISVAREHLATSITESLFNLIYPQLFKSRDLDKSNKVIVTSSVNEYHQIGGKIVSDTFELNGWNTLFLGANTPTKDLLKLIDEEKPDLVAISLSIYFNMRSLKLLVKEIKNNFKDQQIMVGGQAFRWGGKEIFSSMSNTDYIPDINILEKEII